MRAPRAEARWGSAHCRHCAPFTTGLFVCRRCRKLQEAPQTPPVRGVRPTCHRNDYKAEAATLPRQSVANITTQLTRHCLSAASPPPAILNHTLPNCASPSANGNHTCKTECLSTPTRQNYHHNAIPLEDISSSLGRRFKLRLCRISHQDKLLSYVISTQALFAHPVTGVLKTPYWPLAKHQERNHGTFTS